MNKQLTINEIIAIILVVSGIILIFTGMFITPIGEISDSVLWALGQMLALAGGLLGVTTHYNAKLKTIEKKIDNEHNN